MVVNLGGQRMITFHIVALTLVVNRLPHTYGSMNNQLSTALETPNDTVAQEELEMNYTLLTAGCIINRIDTSDPAFNEFFGKLPTPECDQTSAETLIQQTDDGYLRVDNASKHDLMADNGFGTSMADFICEMRTVYRNQVEESDLHGYRVSDNATQFNESAIMDVEYAQVKCMVGDVTVYHNYFYNIIRKTKVETECDENSKIFLKHHPSCVGHPRLSVLVVGIDSVSRANFQRQMPTTYDLIVNTLMGIDMLGYNRVGHNTFPSLTPYLTGNSTEELAKGCWGGGSNTFDNCTFLWDMFAKAGYRTAFVENMDGAGLLIYQKGGSHRQVAHYYGHTLYIPVLRYAMNNSCWRGRADDARVADWAYQFQKQFSKDPHFGHFWMSVYSHNYINMAQHLDPIVSQIFMKMHLEGLLNNTLLIFMSDHGLRFGYFRETEAGRLEENLPFMYLIFPRYFRNKFPEVIEMVRQNSHRLITTFDLHETLKQIINCDYTSYNSSEVPTKSRGVSLFRPISTNRTCDDAGIPSVYCACRANVVEMDLNSTEALLVADLLVRKLNAYTEHVRNICVTFYLEQILSCKEIVQTPDDPAMEPSAIRNTHVISIMVKPGDAKFEATIQYVPHNSSYIVNNDVRRINKYGNSSYCIFNDGFLKSICFCGRN